MIPMQLFPLKHHASNYGEHRQGDNLLNHFQLDEGERTSIAYKTNLVGRYLQRVFEESDCPREGNDANQRPVVGDVHLLQFEMSIPCKGHKDIAADEQQNSPKCVHLRSFQFFNKSINTL